MDRKRFVLAGQSTAVLQEPVLCLLVPGNRGHRSGRGRRRAADRRQVTARDPWPGSTIDF